MNPEDRELLKRTLQLSEENNKMLRKIRRNSRWIVVWGVIKFAVIIGSLVIGYLSLEPYLGSVGESFKQAQGLLNTFQ
ncbi:hypothetical protein KW800_02770 [Candidatus Parcubacteria bacterium]|nr:hypothetical protein [Candidatus Parcubacteria bacterium]